MLSGKKPRIAALSTVVIAFAAMSGSALAQKKYDTGATSTLRLDSQAKALGEWLRSRTAKVPKSLLGEELS